MNEKKYALKKWHVLLLIGIISCAFITSGLIYYKNEEKGIKEEKQEVIRAIADLKISQLTSWLDERIGDAKVYSNSPLFIQGVSAWLNGSRDSLVIESIVKRLEITKKSYSYQNVILVTPEGKTILSGSGGDNEIYPVTVEKIRETIESGNIHFSDFYKCPGHHTIHLDIIAPLKEANGKINSLIIFRIDPYKYLYPLIQSWPIPSRSAETLLIRKEQDSVLFLNEVRHTKNSALELKKPISNKEIIAVKAALGATGLAEGIDYRNEKVLAYSSAIKGTGWFLIAKIDQSEIYSELNVRMAFTFIVTTILIISIALGILWFYHYRQRNLYKELFASEQNLRKKHEEFKTILYSIGDGVITVGNDTRVIQMNGVAENLTGWTEKEAIGIPLEDIFKIVNADTRNTVENPVHKVLREGIIVGLANHTLLITKDGREIPIADSGSPVKNDNGDIEGVVLTFRDQTTEYLAEKIVTQSEARLSRAELASKSGNWEVHLKDRTVIASHGAMKIYGLYPGSITFDMIKDIPLKEYRPMLDDAMIELVRNNIPYNVEFKIKTVDTGEIKDVHSIAEYDRERNIVFGIIRDVTEQKAAEQERFRLLDIIEKSLNEIFVFDMNTLKFTYLNRGAIANIGYPPDEILQMTPFDIKPEYDEAKFRHDIQPLIDGTDEKLIFRTVHQRKDLSSYPVEVHLQLHRFGSAGLFFAIINDITERIKSESAIKESEEKFRSLFEDHTAIELLIDASDGQIIDANKSAIVFYGYPLEKLKAMKISDINTSSPEYVAEKMKVVMETGNGHFIFKHRLANGEIRDIENLSSRINTGGKTLLHSIIHDITDKVRSDKELEQHRNHLEKLVEERTEEIDAINRQLQESLGKEKELNNLKSRFISTASHEFKTPLTAILSSAELIQRYRSSWTEEKIDQYLDRIKGSVSYLTKLTDDVLLVNRIEAGRETFKPSHTNMLELCEKIIQDQKILLKEKHRLEFDYKLKRDIHCVDPKQMELIIHNLLSNAVKYSPRGGVITFSIQTDGKGILIKVADQGIGIPESEQSRLFETFFRAKNAEGMQGTGLGLSIVKHAVTMHGGTIDFESEEGKGTEFSVYIPCGEEGNLLN